MITHHYEEGTTISVPRELKEIDYGLYSARLNELDEAANRCYDSLKELMTYLRKRNYL